MILTRKGDYGVRAIIYLAQQPAGKVSTIKEISETMDIPPVFLTKVMKRFSQQGLVISKRGISGGYMLARPSSSITLRSVIETLEGPISINKCLKKKDPCKRRKECVASPAWEAIQEHFLQDLEFYTIRRILERQ